jgi:hypothetical protein
MNIEIRGYYTVKLSAHCQLWGSFKKRTDVNGTVPKESHHGQRELMQTYSKQKRKIATAERAKELRDHT